MNRLSPQSAENVSASGPAKVLIPAHCAGFSLHWLRRARQWSDNHPPDVQSRREG